MAIIRLSQFKIEKSLGREIQKTLNLDIFVENDVQGLHTSLKNIFTGDALPLYREAFKYYVILFFVRLDFL